MSHRSSIPTALLSKYLFWFGFQQRSWTVFLCSRMYALTRMIKTKMNLHLLSCSNLLSLLLKPHRKHLGAPLTSGFGEKKGLPLFVDTEKPEVSQHPACQTKLGKSAWYTSRLTLSRPVLRRKKKSWFWLNFTPLRSQDIIKALSVPAVGMTSMGSLCVRMEK